MVRELEVSTSPRSTWVWARDVEEAARLKVLLLEADCSVENATGRNADSRILDVDIGYEALEAFKVLSGAGYSFRWHPSQHLMNRHSTLLGVQIVDPRYQADEYENSPGPQEELAAHDRFNDAWDADPDGKYIPGSPGLQRP